MRNISLISLHELDIMEEIIPTMTRAKTFYICWATEQSPNERKHLKIIEKDAKNNRQNHTQI